MMLRILFSNYGCKDRVFFDTTNKKRRFLLLFSYKIKERMFEFNQFITKQSFPQRYVRNGEIILVYRQKSEKLYYFFQGHASGSFNQDMIAFE